MASGKLIAVFGATGQQGGWVARALLQKGYQVRALTRNTDSPKAKALQAAGASTQDVDLDDSSSIESAVQGAHGVFGFTHFWGLFAENPETAFDREVAQAKAIGAACKKLGVKHLVYSGVAPVGAIGGKVIPQIESKTIAEKFFDEIGIPYTCVRYANFHENYHTVSPPMKLEDGTYAITSPLSCSFDTISVADAGVCVAAIFDNPSEYIGKKMDLTAEKITMEEVATIISKVTGKTVKYNQISTSVFAKFPFPGAEDLARMYEFILSGTYNPSLEPARKLNPNMLSFKVWAEKNKDALAAVL